MLRLLLLTANTLNERDVVFGLPYSSARAKLDGFVVTSGLAASPPRAFADRDKGQNLRQAKITGSGNVGKHTNAPFADGTKKMRSSDTGSKKRMGLLQKKRGAC